MVFKGYEKYGFLIGNYETAKAVLKEKRIRAFTFGFAGFSLRVKFLKMLQNENIKFVLKTATNYGCARIYIKESDYEKVEELHDRFVKDYEIIASL